MRRLLDGSALWLTIALTVTVCTVTFVFLVVASFHELGGGTPTWMDLVALALTGASFLMLLSTSVLVVRWLVLKLSKR